MNNGIYVKAQPYSFLFYSSNNNRGNHYIFSTLS